jgi:hypothetical protein
MNSIAKCRQRQEIIGRSASEFKSTIQNTATFSDVSPAISNVVDCIMPDDDGGIGTQLANLPKHRGPI